MFQKNLMTNVVIVVIFCIFLLSIIAALSKNPGIICFEFENWKQKRKRQLRKSLPATVSVWAMRSLPSLVIVYFDFWQ